MSFDSDHPSRPVERRTYGSGWEAQTVNEEIGDFNYESSEAYAVLLRCYGSDLRLKELKAILSGVTACLKAKSSIVLPELSRNAKRSFKLMVKYIQTHYECIAPILPNLILCDIHKKAIPLGITMPEVDNGTSSAKRLPFQ
jgi:hypothetical protein